VKKNIFSEEKLIISFSCFVEKKEKKSKKEKKESSSSSNGETKPSGGFDMIQPEKTGPKIDTSK
jgi:hypothetical protein